MQILKLLFVTLNCFISVVLSFANDTTILPILRRGSEENNETVRHVEDENFRPSIIGSFWYDPINNKFNVSSKVTSRRPKAAEKEPEGPDHPEKRPGPDQSDSDPPESETEQPEPETEPPEPETEPPEPETQPPELETQLPDPELELPELGPELENPENVEKPEGGGLRGRKAPYVFTRFKAKAPPNLGTTARFMNATTNIKSGKNVSSPGRRWLEWLGRKFFRNIVHVGNGSSITTVRPTSLTANGTNNQTVSSHQAYLKRISEKLLKILHHKKKLKQRLKNVLVKIKGQNTTSI